jgi:hypothetical protein
MQRSYDDTSNQARSVGATGFVAESKSRVAEVRGRPYGTCPMS